MVKPRKVVTIINVVSLVGRGGPTPPPDPTNYAWAQYAAHSAGQRGTPRWLHSQGAPSAALQSPGQLQRSPGGMSSQQAWEASRNLETFPYGTPSVAAAPQLWQTAQASIEAAVAETMTMLGQSDWAVSGCLLVQSIDTLA